MDINQLAIDQELEDAGTAVHIRNRLGEPDYHGDENRPVTFTIAGRWSSAFREATQGQQAAARRRGRVGNAEVGAIELAASCILAWEGVYDRGEVVPCTKENAIALLARAPWIRDQVAEAIYDRARFRPEGDE
jgi:hypothetical protein